MSKNRILRKLALLAAVRYKDWKLHFTIMEGAINEAYRKTPSWPLIVNLRMDPFEVGPDDALYIRDRHPSPAPTSTGATK